MLNEHIAFYSTLMEITYPLEGVCLHCNSAVLECPVSIYIIQYVENPNFKMTKYSYNNIY